MTNDNASLLWSTEWWNARQSFLTVKPNGTATEFREYFSQWCKERGISE